MTRLDHDWFPEPLPANVRLGDGVFLHSAYAFSLYRSRHRLGVEIGAHTGVYEGTMFHLGPSGSVSIGEFGTLYGTHFVGNSRIVVGDYAFLSYEVFLSDDQHAVPPVDPGAPTDDAAEVRDPVIVVGDDCWVGMRCVLLPGAALGQGVIVGAGTVVDFEVPPFSIVAGQPARVVGTTPPIER